MTEHPERIETLACSRCSATLRFLPGSGPRALTCERCRAELLVEVFPAIRRSGEVPVSGEALKSDSESSCFYHDRKKAVAVCEECGRFLCSLCEVRIAGRTLCPPCTERGCSDESLEALVTRRTLYDGMALSLSVLPLLFFFMTLVTAPLSIYVAVRFWKKPGSILPRTKFRFVLAILFSLLQLAGWGFVLAEIV